MDSEYIIHTCHQIAEQHYREGEADRADRLAYQVGLLQGKIREICHVYANAMDEIKQLQIELMEASK
jgi:hypothetical protein